MGACGSKPKTQHPSRHHHGKKNVVIVQSKEVKADGKVKSPMRKSRSSDFHAKRMLSVAMSTVSVQAKMRKSQSRGSNLREGAARVGYQFQAEQSMAPESAKSQFNFHSVAPDRDNFSEAAAKHYSPLQYLANSEQNPSKKTADFSRQFNTHTLSRSMPPKYPSAKKSIHWNDDTSEKITKPRHPKSSTRAVLRATRSLGEFQTPRRATTSLGTHQNERLSRQIETLEKLTSNHDTDDDPETKPPKRREKLKRHQSHQSLRSIHGGGESVSGRISRY